jgi:hypothetical protein
MGIDSRNRTAPGASRGLVAKTPDTSYSWPGVGGGWRLAAVGGLEWMVGFVWRLRLPGVAAVPSETRLQRDTAPPRAAASAVEQQLQKQTPQLPQPPPPPPPSADPTPHPSPPKAYSMP